MGGQQHALGRTRVIARYNVGYRKFVAVVCFYLRVLDIHCVCSEALEGGYGKYEGFEDSSDTWCLGSQYWAKNMIPYSAYNKPVYGILLDMVGGRGARFHYARSILAIVSSRVCHVGLNDCVSEFIDSIIFVVGIPS